MLNAIVPRESVTALMLACTAGQVALATWLIGKGAVLETASTPVCSPWISAQLMAGVHVCSCSYARCTSQHRLAARASSRPCSAPAQKSMHAPRSAVTRVHGHPDHPPLRCVGRRSMLRRFISRLPTSIPQWPRCFLRKGQLSTLAIPSAIGPFFPHSRAPYAPLLPRACCVRAALIYASIHHCSPQADCTPLHRAVVSGCVPLVDLLLQHGADREAADQSGWRPLHMAAHYGRAAVVGLLVTAGALVAPPSPVRPRAATRPLLVLVPRLVFPRFPDYLLASFPCKAGGVLLHHAHRRMACCRCMSPRGMATETWSHYCSPTARPSTRPFPSAYTLGLPRFLYGPHSSLQAPHFPSGNVGFLWDLISHGTPSYRGTSLPIWGPRFSGSLSSRR